MAEEVFYSLHMSKRFKKQGRQVLNIGGQLVVFEDGIARRVDETVADIAKRMGQVGRILIHKQPVATPVVAAEPGKEEAPEDNKEEVETADEEKPEKEEQPDEQPEEEEPSLDNLTKDSLQALYDEKGTWSAVADYLDTTTTTLKKHRDELGL